MVARHAPTRELRHYLQQAYTKNEGGRTFLTGDSCQLYSLVNHTISSGCRNFLTLTVSISGEIQSGVPTAVVQVTFPSAFILRQDPKSASLMWPSLSIRTLSGLISLQEQEQIILMTFLSSSASFNCQCGHMKWSHGNRVKDPRCSLIKVALLTFSVATLSGVTFSFLVGRHPRC